MAVTPFKSGGNELLVVSDLDSILCSLFALLKPSAMRLFHSNTLIGESHVESYLFPFLVFGLASCAGTS